MQEVRDTFLHLLADNLPDIPIHPIRLDPRNPSLNIMADNSINVEFLNLSFGHVGKQQVCLDVVHDTEETAIAWMSSLWTLLGSAFYTRLLSYTNPDNPADLGSNVMWDMDSIKFVKVQSDSYTHFACTMLLRFRAI